MRFCCFKIAGDSKSIEVDMDEEHEHKCECENLVELKCSPEEAENVSSSVLESIKKKLNENPLEPRYIYVNIVLCKEGRTIDKMVLFHYNPDNAKIKPKMLYSSSKDALKKVITTSFVDIHITDLNDFTDYKEIRTQILTKSGST